jgi:hypothetical protein
MKLRIALLLVFVGCAGGRTEQAPLSNPPVLVTSPAKRVAKTPSDADALCCCTFSFADSEEFGDIATWDSLASVCPSGDADRMPGKCIDWKWCHYDPGQEPHTLADRPALTPKPPIAASSCCCDVFDGTGENFSVLDAATCAQTADAHCVISDFCGVPAARPAASKKRR